MFWKTFAIIGKGFFLQADIFRDIKPTVCQNTVYSDSSATQHNCNIAESKAHKLDWFHIYCSDVQPSL